MSPRAAWRLESLGFKEVYDYVAGKADWMTAGLPIEGEASEEQTIGKLARRDVPVCGPREPVGQVRERVEAAGWDEAMVVNEQRIVFGRLDSARLASAPETIVASVMETAPVTFRPNTSPEETQAWMDRHGVRRALITGPDGELIGVWPN